MEPFDTFLKKDGLDVKIMFRKDLYTISSSILKEENFHPRFENLEQPHMLNMKGETVPLSKKSVVRAWERQFKNNASFEIVGENVYFHRVFKSDKKELWWGLEMDSPMIWRLRTDLGLNTEAYTPHIALFEKNH